MFFLNLSIFQNSCMTFLLSLIIRYYIPHQQERLFSKRFFKKKALKTLDKLSKKNCIEKKNDEDVFCFNFDFFLFFLAYTVRVKPP